MVMVILIYIGFFDIFIVVKDVLDIQIDDVVIKILVKSLCVFQ